MPGSSEPVPATPVTVKRFDALPEAVRRYPVQESFEDRAPKANDFQPTHGSFAQLQFGRAPTRLREKTRSPAPRYSIRAPSLVFAPPRKQRQGGQSHMSAF